MLDITLYSLYRRHVRMANIIALIVASFHGYVSSARRRPVELPAGKLDLQVSVVIECCHCGSAVDVDPAGILGGRIGESVSYTHLTLPTILRV